MDASNQEEAFHIHPSVSEEETNGPDIDASYLSQGNVLTGFTSNHTPIFTFFACIFLPSPAIFSPLCFPTNIYLHLSFGFVQVSAVVLYTQNRIQFITGSNRERLVQLWNECYKTPLCFTIHNNTAN